MLFSSIYKTTGLLQRIPDDLIWQCGGCNNTLELSWQPSRALGLLPLPGRVSPATDSLNAPLYYNVSFLFTHRRLLVFYYFLINIHPFEYKKKITPVSIGVEISLLYHGEKCPRERGCLTERTSLSQLWRSNISQHSALLCLSNTTFPCGFYLM